MSRSTTMALAFAMAAAAGACAAHQAPTPTVRPQLTGRWVLAQGDTTGPVADSTTVRPAGGVLPAGERGGRHGGGHGDGRDRADSGPRFDPEALGAAAAAVSRGLARVNIAQTDSAVHLDFADGSYFDVATDGRRQQDIWRNIGRIESSARWTVAGLVFERKIEADEGPSITVKQTFARAAGADRVTVTTEIKGQSPRPFTFRRALVPATT